MLGRTRAAALWDRFQLSPPVELRWIASELELSVVVFPFRGRIK